jgi:KRAB domain-containing zinc finger protein
MEDHLTLKDIIGDLFSALEKHSIDFQVAFIDALDDFIEDWLSKHNLPRTPPKKWKKNYSTMGTSTCFENNGLALVPVLVELFDSSSFFRRFFHHLRASTDLVAGSPKSSDSCTTAVPVTTKPSERTSSLTESGILRLSNDNNQDIETLNVCTRVTNNGSVGNREVISSDDSSDNATFVTSLWLGISSGEARVESVAEADVVADVSNSISAAEQNGCGSNSSTAGCMGRKRGRPRRGESRPAKCKLGRPTKKLKTELTDGPLIKPVKMEEVSEDGYSAAEKLSAPRTLRQRRAKTTVVMQSDGGKSDSDIGHESVENTEPSDSPCPAEKRQKSRRGSSESSRLAPTICEICGATVKVLKSHMLKHGEPKYTCPFCPFASRQLQSVNIHISRLHTNYRPHLCEACGKGFVKSSLLKEHIKEKHSAVGRERRYKCSSCSYTAYTRTMVARHEKKHKPCRVPEFRCDICDARLMTIYTLNEHKKLSHNDARPFMCPVCGFLAKSKKRLQSHLRCHEDKRFECDSCQKRFTLHAQLVRHRLVHSGDKPFSCPHCAYRAGIVENLRKHCTAVHKVVFPPRKRELFRNSELSAVSQVTVESTVQQVSSESVAPQVVAVELPLPEISSSSKLFALIDLV